jgi:putative ABC transport system permease protein
VLGGSIGVAGAATVGRLLRGYLDQMSPADALVFTFACALMVVVALGATIVPVRRAASVDPVQTLRRE